MLILSLFALLCALMLARSNERIKQAYWDQLAASRRACDSYRWQRDRAIEQRDYHFEQRKDFIGRLADLVARRDKDAAFAAEVRAGLAEATL